MPKLFVAAELPADAKAELVAVQPAPAPGIRLVEAGQLHLTLHYLGEADAERAERIAIALRAVDFPTFALTIDGVGWFPSAGESTTLWAGVREGDDLRNLHTAVAQALAGLGFRPETRPYMPHVTLARCAPGVPIRVVDDFLTRGNGFVLPAIAVQRFGLYSSILRNDVPEYRRECAFPLRGVPGECP